jgi:signal peptidase II
VVPLSRYFVYFSVVGGGCAVDLATKRWMFDKLGPDMSGEVWWIWPNHFGFQIACNEGALFGMGQGFWAVFAALSVAAALGIFLWLFVAGAAKEWWLAIALSIVTAGILGNLYDRLGLPGLPGDSLRGHHAGETVHAVRDFILMAAGDWKWPNYNVADSLLVCGAIILVLHAFFAKPGVASEPKKTVTPEKE